MVANQPKRKGYGIRFMLLKPVTGSNGESKYLIINTNISTLDFTFLKAVAQKLKNNNLKVTRTDKDDNIEYLTEPKQLAEVITPELRCKKATDKEDKSVLVITMANGKQIKRSKNMVHNLYIDEEDYNRAKQL